DLDEIEPAERDARREAAQIADHSSAQRDQRGVAVYAGVQYRIQHARELAELLARFPGRHDDTVVPDPRIGQAALELRQMQAGYRGVRNSDRPRLLQQR